MEAIKYKVLNIEGQEVGSIDLDPAIFGAQVNEAITHTTVTWQRNKKRAGTHSVLTKGVMRGGNRKPWRQKGTGRARAGSNTSPVWVGGAVAHGPKVHDYVTRVSKRARRQALISALSDKVSQQRLIVLDSLKIESGKTKDAQAVFSKIGVSRTAGLVLPGPKKVMEATPVYRASRNLANVETMPVEAVNPYDVLRLNYLVSTIDGVSALQEMLRARSKRTASAE